jgi:hypothetical protein
VGSGSGLGNTASPPNWRAWKSPYAHGTFLSGYVPKGLGGRSPARKVLHPTPLLPTTLWSAARLRFMGFRSGSDWFTLPGVEEARDPTQDRVTIQEATQRPQERSWWRRLFGA